MLAGDFNIHVEKCDDSHAISLSEIFEVFGLHNVVNNPTHILGGTWDLVALSSNFSVVKCDVLPSGMYSDHGFISVSSVFVEPCKKTLKQVRSWSRVDTDKLLLLVNNSISKNCEFDSADEALMAFDHENSHQLSIR